MKLMADEYQDTLFVYVCQSCRARNRAAWELVKLRNTCEYWKKENEMNLIRPSPTFMYYCQFKIANSFSIRYGTENREMIEI